MKKSLFSCVAMIMVALTVLFGCQKTTTPPPVTTPPKTVPHGSARGVSTIRSNVKESIAMSLAEVTSQSPNPFNGINLAGLDLKTIKRVTFDVSPIVGYTIQNNTDREKYVFLYTFGTKTLRTTAKISTLANGNTLMQLFNANETLEYYQYQVTPNQMFGGMVLKANVPFEQLGAKKAKAGTCMATTTTFGDCMQCAMRECSDSWTCAVMCGLAFPQCAIGWGIACAGGY